ncbi:uncharacterized protein LOC143605175 [Bidens hawaiensis]|uniref:uncharacterized protein LOC143605175 n=1 Tax=Bidens hawaiensis TaxID=980011 RepID=UPI004049BD66
MPVMSRIHQKLAAKFFGPYHIIDKIGPLAYKLQLPPTSKIHLVFHVSLLKKVIRGSSDSILPPELEIRDIESLTPAAILASRVVYDGVDPLEQSQVKWHGKSVEEATCEDSSWSKTSFQMQILRSRLCWQWGVMI